MKVAREFLFAHRRPSDAVREPFDRQTDDGDTGRNGWIVDPTRVTRPARACIARVLGEVPYAHEGIRNE